MSNKTQYKPGDIVKSELIEPAIGKPYVQKWVFVTAGQGFIACKVNQADGSFRMESINIRRKGVKPPNDEAYIANSELRQLAKVNGVSYASIAEEMGITFSKLHYMLGKEMPPEKSEFMRRVILNLSAVVGERK